MEPLETRALLSASVFETTAEPIVLPSVDAAPAASSSPPSGALTPSKIAAYYKFNALPTTSSGVALDGSGTTIAIVTAYNNPTIASDLKTFDKQFGLSDPKLAVVSQTGTGALPATDYSWALETAMDVEWAHAVAPKANILLVEANSSSISDLMQAVKYAAAHADVVSMSWGSSEFRSEKAWDSYFNVPGVTFVTASGDDAGISGASWPSVSPYVVSVGGTTLSGSTETAWSLGFGSGGFSGSGGGVSAYESLPAFQSSVVSARGRVTPDVAYVANPTTGVAVYTATAARGQAGWTQVGGTSAGAPQWAGLVALTDQLRSASGKTKLDSSTMLSLLYAAAKTEGQSTPSTVFHDIASGRNAFYAAGVGYDAVTGLGSPIADNLVSYLTTGKLPTSASTATSRETAPAATTTTVAAVNGRRSRQGRFIRFAESESDSNELAVEVVEDSGRTTPTGPARLFSTGSRSAPKPASRYVAATAVRSNPFAFDVDSKPTKASATAAV